MSDVNKEAITEWVAALRSGDYTQGTGQLARVHDDGSTEYCCLGVACELNAERLELAREVSPSGQVDFNGNHAFLPYRVQNFLGLKRDNPKVGYAFDGYAETGVAVLNDEAGLSFAEIADLIEATYLKGEGE